MSGITNKTVNSDMLKQSLWLLGFPDFLVFRASDLWKDIRDRTLASHPCCFRCRAVAVDVHLARYDLKSVSGDRPESLFSLCRRCFQLTGVCEWGACYGLAQANRGLGIMFKQLPRDEPIRRSRDKDRRPHKSWHRRRVARASQ